jgi:hypothetical protein
MANTKRQGRGGREIAVEYKLLVVQQRMKGAPVDEVARAFGVSACGAEVDRAVPQGRSGGVGV